MSLLVQVLDWVALAVEPVAGVLIDVRSRRVLLTWGAAWVAAAALLVGLAPGYAALLAGFAAYGLGSGPLAHTADVVLVESFQDAGDRVFARATVAGTIGALVGPGAVAAALAAGVSWRVPLVALGLAALAYGVAIGRTRWPAPPASRAARGPGTAGPAGPTIGVARRVAAVLRNRRARRWLLFLFLLDVFEAPAVLRYVWLHEQVGLGTGGVALYAAAEQAAGLVGLLLLDRLLRRAPWHVVLAGASATLAGLTPLWLGAPTTAATVAVGMAMAVAAAMPWPVAKARSLAAVPAAAGAVSALTSLMPIVPLTLGTGALARAVGLEPALLAVMTLAATGMAAAALLAASGYRDEYS